MTSSRVLLLQNVCKQYDGQKDFLLLDINVSINRGELVALIGTSGSGKSSLLQIAGLLDTPTSGEVVLNNINCSSASDAVRTKLRRKFLGFAYQFHHLLQELSVIENVMLPQRILGHGETFAAKTAAAILAEVGLEEKLHAPVSSLSGGERQRVSLARGIVNCPNLLLADEPTGSLDPQTSCAVFDVMLSIVKTRNMAVLVATHNVNLAKRADRILSLQDGTLQQGTTESS